MVDRALPLVQSLETWQEEPVFVGDFFDSVRKLVSHCPARAAGWPKLPTILHAAAEGCGTNLTTDTAQSLVLLEEFIELGVGSRRQPLAERYRPLVQQFLSQSVRAAPWGRVRAAGGHRADPPAAWCDRRATR